MKQRSIFKVGASASLVLLLAAGTGATLAEPAPSLAELVKNLLAQNDSIQTKQLAKRMADAEIEKSLAKFDPQFSASAARNVQKEPNTTEEAVTRGAGNYERGASEYAASISKLLPTGAKFEAKATVSRFMTSAIQQVDPGQPDNVRAYYGLSLMQPLMRDAGAEVNNASVKWAELDAGAAASDQVDTTTAVVAQGLMAFYDLQMAHQQERIEQEKVAMAKRLLKLAKSAEQAGRASRAETWDVENSLSRFEVAALVAVQNRVEQSNRLKTMLMADTDVAMLGPVADLLPQVQAQPQAREELVQSALAHRADYQRQQLTLQRAQSQLDYANNQREPRVDLTLSYGQNGLAYTWNKAMSNSNTVKTPTWSVGLQFQTPLGSNREGEASYVQARARVEEAQLALDALKISIGNDIDSSVKLVQNVGQRWAHWAGVNKREQEQLTLERERLSNGRSDLRELLFKEERALNAQMSLVEQRVGYAKAQVLQHAAVGTLLNHYAAQ